MRHLSLKAVCILLLLAVALGQAGAAPQYPISYILSSADTLVNTAVTTSGFVVLSQVVPPPFPPQPGPTYKGEFWLQDSKDGKWIRVRTTDNPPALYAYYPKLTGYVGKSSGEVVLLQAQEFPWLYLALGVLVLLAIVLVAVLVKRPSGPGPSVSCPHCSALNPMDANVCERCGQSMMMVIEDTGHTPPPPPPGMPCPHCGVEISPSSAFCESCGERTAPGSGTAPPTIGPGGSVHSSGGAATTRIPASVEVPPIADLVVVDGPGGRQGTRLGLRAGQQKIGRDPDRAEIVLHDDTVSREHALIWQQDGSFYLQDENSTAGTFVNGNRVTREALNDGDTITLGKTKLVFRSVTARQ